MYHFDNVVSDEFKCVDSEQRVKEKRNPNRFIITGHPMCPVADGTITRTTATKYRPLMFTGMETEDATILDAGHINVVFQCTIYFRRCCSWTFWKESLEKHTIAGKHSA